ncbi:MAG: hypothetical protein WBE11_18420 [Candidatus Aminicenantaceae bacterium]
MAKEKFQATAIAYANNHMTVVGDLGTKVVEQLIEADAARNNAHFGDHQSRHEFSNENYPLHINRAMRKIWFAYADLGYDGVNGKRAQAVVNNLKVIIKFFEKRFGRIIDEKNM